MEVATDPTWIGGDYEGATATGHRPHESIALSIALLASIVRCFEALCADHLSHGDVVDDPLDTAHLSDRLFRLTAFSRQPHATRQRRDPLIQMNAHRPWNTGMMVQRVGL
jgi:hypothetical protein